MKKLLTIILCLFFLCFSVKIKAQLLFEENFNSYPIGHLNANYDNTTPGQGGWLVGRNLNNSSVATGMITAEPSKGNVLTMTTALTTGTDSYIFKQEDDFLSTMWNNRTSGNNIFKFEYEFYAVGYFNHYVRIHPDNVSYATSLIGTAIDLNRILGSYTEYTGGYKALNLKYFNTTPFPHNTWIKLEAFIDYNTNNVYFYIPTLNLQATAPFYHNDMPVNLRFATSLNATSIVKIDNIKVSGLKTLPSYILSTNEQLAARFNMYPNPATNVVNITNTENMLVNQVTIYDITGKQLSTQSFNSETEIQLNVENLASGTYMLHLKTNEGIAVKKLVKN